MVLGHLSEVLVRSLIVQFLNANASLLEDIPLDDHFPVQKITSDDISCNLLIVGGRTFGHPSLRSW